jgi:cell division protease FtsH
MENRATMAKLLIGIVLGFIIGFIIAVFVVLGLLFNSPRSSLTAPRAMTYSAFIAAVDDGKVEEVVFQGANLTGRFKDSARLTDGTRFETLVPHTQLIPALTDRLLASKVAVVARPENDTSDTPWWVSVAIAWLPFLIAYGVFFGGLWLFLARPVMALTRQLEAYTKAAHSGGNPA